MQDTWVRFLGWEDPLEKGTPTYSNILAWSHKELDATEWLNHFHFSAFLYFNGYVYIFMFIFYNEKYVI